jgi:hypothetical protein
VMASASLISHIHLLGQCTFPGWERSATCIDITSYMCLVHQLNKETYNIVYTSYIISVLFSTKCHLFHDVKFFCSNNSHIFHKPCTKNVNTNPAIETVAVTHIKYQIYRVLA